MEAQEVWRQKFLLYLAPTSGEPIGVVVEQAEGCWIIAKDGKRYLDFISGIPPPKALPTVKMSGTTPQCSKANHLPVLPKPV